MRPGMRPGMMMGPGHPMMGPGMMGPGMMGPGMGPGMAMAANRGPRRLHIVVKEGRDLDCHNSADPFVHCECSHGDARTRQGKGKNPSWNETIELEVDGNSPIQFHVRDKDLFTSDVIGTGTLPAMQYNMPGMNMPIQLVTKHGNPGGTITVEIRG